MKIVKDDLEVNQSSLPLVQLSYQQDQEPVHTVYIVDHPTQLKDICIRVICTLTNWQYSVTDKINWSDKVKG